MTAPMTIPDEAVQADKTLWCVNIKGPDDIVSAPDHLSAVRMANTFNAWWLDLVTKTPLTDNHPRMWAEPIEWPYSEGHGEDVTDPNNEYQWLRELASLPFLQGVKPEALQLIERMAFGYEVMFEKLCHISGTSGESQSWYMAKAREATDRISPLYSITVDSNKVLPGDCKQQYRDFMSRILSKVKAPEVDNKSRAELDLSNLLRHAFISGFEAKGGTITDAINYWPDYNPEKCSAYSRILSAIEVSAPETGIPATDKTVKRRIADALESVWGALDCSVEEIENVIVQLKSEGLDIIDIGNPIPAPSPRACTCHPDDNPPVPCSGKYALSDCQAASPRAQALEEAAMVAEARKPLYTELQARNACAEIASSIRALSSQPVADTPAAASDVLAERRRQVTDEGLTPEHDDKWSSGEIAQSAACYALLAAAWNKEAVIEIFPWSLRWLKSTNPRRNLVKSGALIIAEIERLDRRAASPGASEEPFPQPSRKDGGEPCAECHLQLGETCDICGATRPTGGSNHGE